MSFTSQISNFLLKYHLFKPTNQQQATLPIIISTISPLQSFFWPSQWEEKRKMPLPPYSLQRNLSFQLQCLPDAAQGKLTDVVHPFSSLHHHCSSHPGSHTAEWPRLGVSHWVHRTLNANEPISFSCHPDCFLGSSAKVTERLLSQSYLK